LKRQPPLRKLYLNTKSAGLRPASVSEAQFPWTILGAPDTRARSASGFFSSSFGIWWHTREAHEFFLNIGQYCSPIHNDGAQKKKGTNSPNGSPGRALPGGQSPGAAPQLKKYERYEKRNKAQSTGIHRAAFHAGASPKSVVSNVAETARTDDVKEIPTRFNARAHFAQLHSRRQELMNQLLATFTQEGFNLCI